MLIFENAMSLSDIRVLSSIKEVLAKHPSEASEFTATNVWAWRRSYPRQVVDYRGHIILGYPSDDVWVCLAPIGPDPVGVIQELTDSERIVWHRVPASIACSFKDLEVIPDPNEDDHIYKCGRIQKFEGGRYKKIRQHISIFERKCRPEFKPFSFQLADDCKVVCDKWLAAKGDNILPVHVQDVEAALEAVALSQFYPLNGLVVYSSGEPIGFFLGEQLNNNSWVGHFSKSDLSVGVAEFMLKQWALTLPEEAMINLEQSQGDPGLTTFKKRLAGGEETYVSKYTIRPK